MDRGVRRRRRDNSGTARGSSWAPLPAHETGDRQRSTRRGNLETPMKIPFTKAHGARNDFLLTWRAELPNDLDFPAAAQAICERHTGVGADGWLLLSPAAHADVKIELYNSDGSLSELSGNG